MVSSRVSFNLRMSIRIFQRFESRATIRIYVYKIIIICARFVTYICITKLLHARGANYLFSTSPTRLGGVFMTRDAGNQPQHDDLITCAA